MDSKSRKIKELLKIDIKTLLCSFRRENGYGQHYDVSYFVQVSGTGFIVFRREQTIEIAKSNEPKIVFETEDDGEFMQTPKDIEDIVKGAKYYYISKGYKLVQSVPFSSKIN